MSTTAPDLRHADPAVVLFGQTRRRLLAWLLLHPDETFYLRQLARQTGVAPGAIQRELAALTRAGILSRAVQGRQVYFGANRESPIYLELHGLVVKTMGVADVLRAALATLGESVRVAFVFGSAARRELRAGSDIDLLVVGTASFRAVASALAAAQEQLGRDVNPTVYPEAEFRAKVRAAHHFLSTVLRAPRVFVIGGPNELARVAAKRLGDDSHEQSSGDPGPARRRRTRPAR
jgi:predicted nucleotidyltransferase